MGNEVITYFKEMAEETGIPYQSLINLYLRDCVAHNRKPDLSWRSPDQARKPKGTQRLKAVLIQPV